MHFGDLLKEVIKEYGLVVLDKDHLLSILLDKGLNTNRDISPAERAIIKELSKEGVFKDIYKNCTKEKWELTFRQLAHHIIDDNGRQEQVVNSLFQEIAVALGFNASSSEWGSDSITKSNVKVKVVSEDTKRAATGVEKDAVVKKKSSSSEFSHTIFGTMIASAATSFARHLATHAAEFPQSDDADCINHRSKGPHRENACKKTTSKKNIAGKTVKKQPKAINSNKQITVPHTRSV